MPILKVIFVLQFEFSQILYIPGAILSMVQYNTRKRKMGKNIVSCPGKGSPYLPWMCMGMHGGPQNQESPYSLDTGVVNYGTVNCLSVLLVFAIGRVCCELTVCTP